MSPVFAHGQLRLYLLALLDETPMHGYDVMRALEDRFSGMYTPSAGTVYPRLARLEEEGMVSRNDAGRKAVYAITDAGRAELERRRPELTALESDLDDSVAQLARELRQQVRGTSRSLRAELSAAARTARKEASTAVDPAVDGQWARSPLAREVELAANLLREEARRIVRRRGVDEQTLLTVRELLESTRRALRDVES